MNYQTEINEIEHLSDTLNDVFGHLQQMKRVEIEDYSNTSVDALMCMGRIGIEHSGDGANALHFGFINGRGAAVLDMITSFMRQDEDFKDVILKSAMKFLAENQANKISGN